MLRVTVKQVHSKLLILSFIFGHLCLNSNGSSAAPKEELSRNAELLQSTLNSSLPLPFDQIHNDNLEGLAKDGLEHLKARLSRILENASTPSFANTFLAMDQFLAESQSLKALFESVYVYLMRSPNSEKAYELFEEGRARLLNDFFLSSHMKERFAQVASEKAQNPDTVEAQRRKEAMIEKILKLFEASGANLSNEQRKEKISLDREIQKWENQFSRVITEARSKVRILLHSASELEGLSQTLIDEAQQRAKSEGHPNSWSLAIVGSTYLNVLTEARNRELRKQIFIHAHRASPNIGAYSTETKLLSEAKSKSLEAAKEMTRLRSARAQLMGFEHASAAVVATQSAPNVETVENFLLELARRSKVKAQAEWEELSVLAKADGIEQLEAWDVMYYRNRALETFLNTDTDELQAYFELEGTLKRSLDYLGKVFDLRFVEAKDLPVYHEDDVKAYRVIRSHQDQADEILAHVYLDLYGRSTKSGAFISTLKSRRSETPGSPNSPASLVVSYNFTKLPPDSSEPNLLRFEELRTLLHELGHVLHAVLADTTFHVLSGPDAVAYDFVEFPSKLFENWITDPHFMQEVARHYKDNDKSLPLDLLEKLAQTQNFMPGLLYLSKSAYSLLDLAWHAGEGPRESESVQDFEKRIIGPILVHPFFENSTLSSTFTHIFAGSEYASLFYSYLYSQAYADMAFPLFEAEGTQNPDTGKRLESEVLSRGGMACADKLFEGFTGEPRESFEVFFEKIGL